MTDETIEYRTGTADLDAADLEGFFEGWPSPPSPARHLEILEASDVVVLAVDPGADRVAGFVNAITDGLLAAYIPLLEVRPVYRGRGIGSRLVERVKTELGDLYMIDAICDEEIAPFYERLDFQRLAGMAYRNYEHQSG